MPSPGIGILTSSTSQRVLWITATLPLPTQMLSPSGETGTKTQAGPRPVLPLGKSKLPSWTALPMATCESPKNPTVVSSMLSLSIGGILPGFGLVYTRAHSSSCQCRFYKVARDYVSSGFKPCIDRDLDCFQSGSGCRAWHKPGFWTRDRYLLGHLDDNDHNRT